MSELDGASPKEMEEFERKYVDTLTELKAKSALEGIHKGTFKNGSLVKDSPGDKNAARVKELKRPIEARGMEKQRENIVGYLSDAFQIRHKEILNKEDISIKDLLNTLARFLPQNVNSEVNTTHTFAEEIKRLTIEKKTYKAIDADLVSAKDDDE